MSDPRRISRRVVCAASVAATWAPVRRARGASEPPVIPAAPAPASVSVLQFGADRTSAASSVAAFNRAIAWANARATQTSGVSIAVPDGAYRIDADLDPILASNVYLQATRAAVLNVSAPGAVFTWTGGAFGGGILGGMSFTYPADPAPTAALLTISSAYRLIFEGLSVTNINTLAILGTGPDAIASAISFVNPMGGVFNSGQPTFDCRWGSDLSIHNGDIYVAGVPVPAFDRVSTMATVPGTNFLNFTRGGWDDAQLSGTTRCNRYWRAVNVSAPGSVVTNLWLNDSIFDYNSDDAIHLDAPANATGAVANVYCTNSYMVSWSGHGLYVNGGVNAENLDLSGSHINQSGKHGVYLTGANARTIKLNNLTISNPGRLGVGLHAGIRVDAIFGDWECIGTHVLTDPTLQPQWRPAFGIDIAPGNDRFTVASCNMAGSVKNYRIAADATFSRNRLVTNNLNADYAGLRTGGLWTRPASRAPWRNTSPWVVQVMMSGMTDIALDGANLGVASAQLSVPPGHSVLAAYAGAPKMLFLVEA